MRSRIIAALSLFLVACSAIATFDGLVGSGESTDGGAAADGAKLGDGSVTPTADGSVDDTTDGSSFDGGSAADSGMTRDGTVAGFCATHPGHTYCDDFDPSNSLGNRWMTHVGIGSVGVGTTDFVSPPRAAFAASPDTVAGQDGEDDIEKIFPGTASIDVEAAMKVTITASTADFIAIEFLPTDTSVYKSCYFDVAYFTNGGTVLESECNQPDGGEYYASSTLAAAAPNRDRVHLGVDMSKSQITGTMAGTTKTLAFPGGLSTTQFTALAGVVYKATDGNAFVHVDDVIIDAK